MNATSISITSKTIELIIVNGGATLTQDLENATLTSGYMVSMEEYETTIDLSVENANDLLIETIQNYQILAEKYEAFIGVWIDENIAYVDLSKNYKDRLTAIKIGKLNNQLAIYDLKNKSSIRL